MNIHEGNGQETSYKTTAGNNEDNLSNVNGSESVKRNMCGHRLR